MSRKKYKQYRIYHIPSASVVTIHTVHSVKASVLEDVCFTIHSQGLCNKNKDNPCTECPWRTNILRQISGDDPKIQAEYVMELLLV